MIITAFKQEQDLYRMQFPLWFHLPPTLKHFHLLFTQTWFGSWVVNTTAVSIAVVAITLAAAVPAAYALARLRLPGAHATGTTLFMTYLVPPIILFVPLAPLIGRLGLFDTWWALVLLYPTFTIPFCTWLMLGFLRTVPREVEEAAWIDGCGVLGGIVRVVLPLSLPGIATIAISRSRSRCRNTSTRWSSPRPWIRRSSRSVCRRCWSPATSTSGARLWPGRCWRAGRLPCP